MDKTLKQLMDYQKFAKNAHLQSLIDDTLSRYSHRIDEDDLDLVNAAGTLEGSSKNHINKTF